MVLDSGAFEGTVLAGVILAGAARTLIPYLAKRQADLTAGLDPRPFSLSYIITGVLGIIPVAVGATLLLPTILPQVSAGGSQLMVFVTSFGLAYATTDIVNRNVSTLGIPALTAGEKVSPLKTVDTPIKGTGKSSETGETQPTGTKA
jgi:uncharacterized membrane protein